MEEKDFYRDNNVSVTNSRFTVGSTTYAMNGVTSVKRGQWQIPKILPIIVCIIGFLFLIISNKICFIIGAALIVLGIWWFRKIKPIFIVYLNSASGESQALSSKDLIYINKVINALNDAIIHRG